jgi:hypothetical protein
LTDREVSKSWLTVSRIGDPAFSDRLSGIRAPEFAAKLAAVCPKGIDVYFENVGGAVWQAVLPLLNKFARVPVSGLIAQYNPRNYQIWQNPENCAYNFSEVTNCAAHKSRRAQSNSLQWAIPTHSQPLCVPGYAKKVRAVPAWLKRQAYVGSLVRPE